MSSELIGILIVAVTVVIVVILWQGMNVARTQISADQLQNYQRLAEQAAKAAEAQQKTAEALEEIQARLAAIEKLLKEVQ